MKRQVQVKIVGEVTDEWGEKDAIRLETTGTLYVRGDEYVLVYKESEAAGLGETFTSLRIRGGRVILNRTGTVDIRQEFEPGEAYRGVYATPHGRIPMMVVPSRVEVDFSPRGGVVEMEYELLVDEAKVSDHRLSIRVKGEDLG